MEVELLMELTEKYLREIIKFCNQFAHPAPEKGLTKVIRGVRRIIGSVRGRPRTEDAQVGIDKVCDDILRRLLQQYRRLGLRVRVYSEHGTFGDSDPQHLCASDPFDGSGIFRRGLIKEWYSVLSFFNLAGEPLCGGSSDILQKEIYLAGGPEGVVRISENARTKVSASRKEKLDQSTVIAAYLMNRDYRRDWEEKTKRMGDKFPGLLVWPNGGSCIYHHIACGQIQAYIMFKEPRSEIDPGLAFAKSSPFPIVSVREDGSFENYRFEPGKQGERVPFFIAACTEELVKSIIEAILSP